MPGSFDDSFFTDVLDHAGGQLEEFFDFSAPDTDPGFDFGGDSYGVEPDYSFDSGYGDDEWSGIPLIGDSLMESFQSNLAQGRAWADSNLYEKPAFWGATPLKKEKPGKPEDKKPTETPAQGVSSPLPAINPDFLAAANAESLRTGLPLPLILAISQHESAGGTSNLASTQNNYFGMKDSSDASGWARFASPGESVRAFVGLITNPQGRYANAFASRADPDALIQGLADAGYIQADEKDQWVARVKRLYRQFDNPVPPAGAPTPPAPAAAPMADTGQQPVYRTQFGFGSRYTNPAMVRLGHHRGVDLVRDDMPNQGRGSPVNGFAAGTVFYIDRDEDGGLGVGVRDGQGQDHYYFHLDGTNLTVGETVQVGGVIGTLGASGINGPQDGGPHLHYEVRREGTKQEIDPSPWVGRFTR